MTVASAPIDACDACLRRTDLIAALAGRIDVAWRRRADTPRRLLALPDEALLDLDPSGRAGSRYAGFGPAAARARIEAAGLVAFCRCATRYPAALRELEDPPAVVHIAGRGAVVEAEGRGAAVAVIGARRASAYGLEVARGLGRDLSSAGVVVVSGMALGADAAAHQGALAGPGETVAVLATGADVPYPAGKWRLYGDIVRRGAVVSELPPGFRPHRWCFVARNRLIAALTAVTVVVEATARSGSLITAGFAADLGRTVGAVPGQVTAQRSEGTNRLLADGATVVRDAHDVLGQLPWAGEGARAAVERAREPVLELGAELAALLGAVEAGEGTLGQLSHGDRDPRAVLRGLTELEVHGLVRRDFGGRYVRAA